MANKYTCYGCETASYDEEAAKACCAQWIEGKGGEKVVPKQFRTHIKRGNIAKLHICEKMLINNKQWQCELNQDEVCPECGYEWYPR